MKRLLIFAAMAIIILTLGLSGCTLISKDLIGTWMMTSGGNTMVVVFESRTISINQTSPVGSLSFSVQDFDEDAGHIDSTVTSSSGTFSGISVDDHYYWYYEIQPDGLHFMFTPVTYPPAVQSGPFTKI